MNSDKLKQQELLAEALQLYAYISPVKSLNPLEQGNVVVSKSGNLRLVLFVKRGRLDANLLFLTQTASNQLKVEKAPRSQIDIQRVSAVVVRREVNPLGNFDDELAGFGRESVIFENTSILLQHGRLGQYLSQLIKQTGSRDDYENVTLYVSTRNGKIEGINQSRLPQSTPIKLLISKTDMPTREYLTRLAFHPNFPERFKRQLIAAGILANTLMNAKHLAHLVQEKDD